MTLDREVNLADRKPCPFCGSKNLAVMGGTTFRWHAIECLECEARCGEVRVEAGAAALEAEWDKRA